MIRSDNGLLRWLFKFTNSEGQLSRWLETLSAFTYQIEHRPVVKHRKADALSRVPRRQCGLDSELESQKQEENVTDEPEVKSATSVMYSN